MSKIIQDAYSPEKFKRQGYEMIDLLAEYLTEAQSNTTAKTINFQEAHALYDAWKTTPPQTLLQTYRQVLKHSNHLHFPKYVGHQVTAPAPTAALAALFAALINNGMAIYEVGNAATVLERIVVEQVAQKIGYDKHASGLLTSGGTLGNLTALLTARSVKVKENIWETGGHQQLAIMVSEEAHYCVDRAIRIMGWGSKGIIKIPTDGAFRMDTSLLDEYYQKAKARGVTIIAVVGSACSTSTGSFDDLNGIADFCEQNDLWFHIDGAHGGATIYSETYKQLVAGIERADSVVMDFHKMMLVPALVTGLFYKNGQTSYQTFAQKAHYLWSNDEQLEWQNIGKRSFECTKLMMSVQVYSILQEYGTELWSAFVTQCYDIGKQFANLIGSRPNFELGHEPDCNIVCFRYAPKKFGENLSSLNANIRARLLEDGEFYFVQTQLKGETYLRTTLINPFTTIADLELLLDKIEHTGNSLRD